jgi:hypothetical protein
MNMKLFLTSQTISDCGISCNPTISRVISKRYSIDLSFMGFYGMVAFLKKRAVLKLKRGNGANGSEIRSEGN